MKKGEPPSPTEVALDFKDTLKALGDSKSKQQNCIK